MRRLGSRTTVSVAHRTKGVAELIVPLRQTGPRRWFCSSRVVALQSPTWDAANRLTNPSREFPATGTAPAADPDDPCVMWREYWSPAHGVPYYHNLRTHDVSWNVPDGFKTRFPQFHSNNARLEIDDAGRIRYRSAGGEGVHGLQETKSAVDPTKPMSLKQKLALYGSGGLILYLIIHNIFLSCVFVSIYFLGIDLVSIAKQYGFSISRSSTDGASQNRSLAGTFVTAVLLNKMTVPVQLVLTLALAPRFVPRLQPLGNRLVPLLKKMWPFGKSH